MKRCHESVRFGRDSTHALPVDLGPLQYTEIALPDGERLACYEEALLLITDAAIRLAVLIARGEQHGPGQSPLQIQVLSSDRDVSGAFLAGLRELRHDVNIYRCRVLAVAQGDTHNPFSNALTLQFVDPGAPSRDDVVLPAGLLERIERHTIGFAGHTAQLRSAGRSLHRGLLLYGPPGTGKTHTVRYLSAAMSGRTTLIISGAAFGVLPSICGLAHDLAPSMVVLEDVDLVAHERTMHGPGQSPLLFTLMNEMDGIGPDADVIFLLTTNRADVLEPALAARPGRIDLAVEIPAPDADARARLIALYGRGMTMQLGDITSVVTRTEGVSAAFIKEMLRRASLIAAMSTDPAAETGLIVTSDHVDQALAEMLDASDSLTRSLLGAEPSTESGTEPTVPGYPRRCAARTPSSDARRRRGNLPRRRRLTASGGNSYTSRHDSGAGDRRCRIYWFELRARGPAGSARVADHRARCADVCGERSEPRRARRAIDVS